MKAKEVHQRTALGAAPFRERQPPFLRLKKNLWFLHMLSKKKTQQTLCNHLNFSIMYVKIYSERIYK